MPAGASPQRAGEPGSPQLVGNHACELRGAVVARGGLTIVPVPEEPARGANFTCNELRRKLWT